MIGDAIREVIEGRILSPGLMEAAMGDILEGRASEVEIAALAVALRMRGETAEELAAAARVLRRCASAVTIEGEGALLDTCGTGGDSAGTLNVSTLAAIVVAACGVRVAKHGNRAVSSRAGSADVLEALGVRIELEPAHVARSVREIGIGFLFAPAHHSALRHAGQVRRAIRARTFFNLLGPLANPAGATHQLVGVYDRARVIQLAEVLGQLGSTRVWVVHGEGGLDEISPAGPTLVTERTERGLRTFEVTPEDFGLARAPLDAIRGGDAATNATIARAVLAGEPSVASDVVCMNAAAALVVAEHTRALRDAMEVARDAIASGAAERILARWIAHSSEGQ